MSADGSIEFSVELDEKEAEKELSSLKKKILDLEADLAKQQRRRGFLVEEMERAGAATDEAKAKLRELTAERDRLQALTPYDGTEYLTVQQRLPTITAEIKEQEKTVKELEKDFNSTASAVEACDSKIQELTIGLDVTKEQFGAVSQTAENLPAPVEKTSAAAKEAAKRMETFTARVKGLVKQLFAFSLISSALRSMRTWLGNAVKSNDQAAAAIARLKGALLSLAQPILTVVIPAFTAFINLLTRIVNAVSNVVSALFGTTASASAEAAEALYNEQNALDGVGGAAKDAGKSLACFDEINKLDTSSGGGGSAAGSSSAAPDFSSVIDQQMSDIELLVSGALLALGAILTFSGANIPLGLGLMAVGALGLASYVKENWETIHQKLQEPMGKIVGIISGALLALGAILTFSGANIPLGIGMMIVGAAGLATVAALNWDKIRQKLQGPLVKTVALVSGMLLATGAVIAFSGASLPLGIGLMVAGAAGLATTVALNWDKIRQELQGPLGGVVAIVSTALLALGAILAFSGVGLPLGIALMAAGAAGLATVTALNWNNIIQELQGPLGGVVAIASAALLALGVILALSGVGLPLGIALIAAGAAGLVTVTALNWDAIKNKLSDAWGRIKQWFQSSVAPKLTLSYWQDKFSTIAQALENKIKGGINAAITLFNCFIGWVNEKMNLSWEAGTLFGKEIIPAGSIQLLTLPNIPLLAQGAVIPPNREFLAVLGDQSSGNNIEAPEALLRQMAQEAAGSNTALLREIIQLMKDGRVLVVNDQAFAELVYQSNNRASTLHGGSMVSVRSYG